MARSAPSSGMRPCTSTASRRSSSPCGSVHFCAFIMQLLLLVSFALCVYFCSVEAINPWQELNVDGTKPSGQFFPLTFRNGTNMLLFGGARKLNGNWEYYNDLWKIDLLSDNPKWEVIIPNGEASSPSKRYGSAGVTLDDKMYFFGGFNGNRLNDLWSFDLVSATWSPITQQNGQVWPTGRNAHAAALRGSSMYIFGGHHQKAFANT